MTSSFEQRRVGQTNIEIGTLGFGCASIGNLYREVSHADSVDTLRTALSGGFRYFDTAPHYGQGLSERRLGDVLRSVPDQNYILSTKVGRLLRPAGFAKKRHGFLSPMPFDIVYDYSYDGVMRSYEDSLQRLGLDRVDILYMHDIGAYTHGADNKKHFPIAMDGGYRAMDELRRNGQVGAIGLGVNEFQVCEAALDYGDWDCFLLASRYTLLEAEALQTFLPLCEARDCSVIIGGVYNSGILATGVRGEGPWYYDYGLAPEEVVRKVRAIEDICSDFGVPLAAAALQFPLAHPAVASVLTGTGSASRVTQTLDLFNTEIPAELWQALIDQSLLRADAPVPTSRLPGAI
jgi:D-threo-aldose 1-dehydrogenase